MIKSDVNLISYRKNESKHNLNYVPSCYFKNNINNSYYQIFNYVKNKKNLAYYKQYELKSLGVIA